MTAACQYWLGMTVPDTWLTCLSWNSGLEQLFGQRWLDYPKSTPNHARQNAIDRWIPSRTSILLEKACGRHDRSDREATMMSNKEIRRTPCLMFARWTFCAASWRCARMEKLRKGNVEIRRLIKQDSVSELTSSGPQALVFRQRFAARRIMRIQMDQNRCSLFDQISAGTEDGAMVQLTSRSCTC